MTRKSIIILLLTVVATMIIGLITYIVLKDEVQEIEEIVYSMNQPEIHLAHIEFLDSNHAIAFYEWGIDDRYFGNALLNRNFFNWKFDSGGSGQISSSGQVSKYFKLQRGFSNLSHRLTSLDNIGVIYGKILDSNIEEVLITTKNNEKYYAEIITYDLGEFWFFVSDLEETLGATITGLSKDGEILEEFII